ncbi:MAG: galactokinase [Actinomycetota bacterium]|nr:galactokinase [Actinomycetota bacterium]
MRETEKHAVQAYEKTFGAEPEIVASAPGRVNLIGEHTDYNGGFVLPFAIDRRIAVAIGRGGGRLHSTDYDKTRNLHGEDRSWAQYPRGVAWAMREAGHGIGDFQAAFAGDIPSGAGLSSSAAIEAATALALDALFGLDADKKDLAVACRRAENEFVGLQSGIMDQYASLLCDAGAALFIDCRSLEATRVPLDLEGAGLTLLVCDTRVKHGAADTGYNERRAECDRAAKALGVKELRDAREEDLGKLSGKEQKRARHIVTENVRTLQAVDALGAGDFDAFGRLMYESHRSMRDDFEMSTDEIDTAVRTAQDLGAPGARLTGGGFGGCAIILVPIADTTRLRKACLREFAEKNYKEPVFYEFVPVAGAEVIR